MIINETNKYSTKDIAVWIRETLKKDFPNCKFSVTSEYYSMGSCINLYLMEADRRVKQTFEELSQEVIFKYSDDGLRTPERLRSMQEQTNHQLNEYSLTDEYDPQVWNNGVFLTEEGFNLLKRIVAIANKYNHDNSDPITDYFDVNYPLHLQLGKWNKEYIDGQEKEVTIN